MVRSGATPEEAEKVTVQIEGWLPGVAVNGVVNTTDIRTKVLELLRVVNPTAASNFEAYQKPVSA